MVDLGDFSEELRLARTLDIALRNWGLFFVRNHGIDESLIARMWEMTRALHAAPDEVKDSLVSPCGHMGYAASESEARFENAFPESCANASENRWPSQPRTFRETCVEFVKAVDNLGRRLLPLMEKGMGLGGGQLVDAFQGDSLSFLNLRHMRAGAKTNVYISPHTDSGVLTFIPQQDKPGYQVCLTDGRWIDLAAPSQATNGTWFLVQAGDCLRRWTNHRYLSALHRVMNVETNQGDRYAMPIFWGPGSSTLMRTLPTKLPAGCEPPEQEYEPITYADYMAGYDAGKLTTISTLTEAQRLAAALSPNSPWIAAG